MVFQSFPALLKSDYNIIHEYGQATVSENGLEIDFFSDFVPLIPLGTPAVVYWILGDRVIAEFRGIVYLSSKNLLRLIEVDSKILSQARILLVSNTQLPATFTTRIRDFANVKNVRHPAEIVYLSTEQIKLKTPHSVLTGDRLYLNAEVDFLTLRNLCLLVHEHAPLGKNLNLVLCSVENTGKENFIALSTYAAKLEKNN